MVRYNKNVENFGVYLKEVLKYSCKIYAISVVIFLPLAIYCIVVGYITKDKEVCIMGGSAAVLTVMSVVVILQRYLVIKKTLKMFFKNADSQGNLNFLLEVIDEKLSITCINTGEITKIGKDNIKKLSRTKNMIFIRTYTKGLVSLPNNKEVRDLLETGNMFSDKK